MTSLSFATQPRVVRTMETICVAGGSAVLLLALAGLLNYVMAKAALPGELRNVAITAHLVTILLALPLGISQIVLPKGGLRHRVIGYVWLALMVTTALVSFGIHTINPHGFAGLSPIHILSALTLIQSPSIALDARRGEHAKHRFSVLCLIIGGLVVAGAFTFLPGRLLGQLAAGLVHGL